MLTILNELVVLNELNKLILLVIFWYVDDICTIACCLNSFLVGVRKIVLDENLTSPGDRGVCNTKKEGAVSHKVLALHKHALVQPFW